VIVRRAKVSRATWYGNGWSVHFFPWGVHIRRRRVSGRANWRQYRFALFSRKNRFDPIRLIDFSTRDTANGASKPVRPCWRFWVGFKVGRTPSTRWYPEEDD